MVQIVIKASNLQRKFDSFITIRIISLVTSFVNRTPQIVFIKILLIIYIILYVRSVDFMGILNVYQYKYINDHIKKKFLLI